MELDAERGRLELDKERQKLKLEREKQELSKEHRKFAAERERLRKENERTKVASLPPDTFTKARRSMDRRYTDNGKGTIKDTNTGLMWTREDSYADLGKCLDWNASKSYVSRLNTGRL